MKVVYTKTILEKMDDEILQSYILNKKIEKFIFSVDEWEELCTKFKHICTYPFGEGDKLGEGHKATYKGIPIYIEQEEV